MIEWVYRRVKSVLPRVVVATDDRRIADAVKGFGGEAVMTPVSCPSGTDRMACVAKKVKARYYANIQGDEPLIHASTIRGTVAAAMRAGAVATAATDLNEKDRSNPNVVKVVAAKDGRALYFSRSMIPFDRDGAGATGLKHMGLYVYPRKALLAFVKLKPAPLEKIEKLEQLRALYHGMPMVVAFSRHDSIGVDTPKDLTAAAARLGGRKKYR
jgi:3-deoxy-manno-octulosonate cytidylyltransferase (CMP-KDO synthetase)